MSTAAVPTIPVTSRDFRYRSAAKTDVSLTIDAARKRIGALTGAQVREARRRAERFDAEEEQLRAAEAAVVSINTPPRKVQP